MTPSGSRVTPFPRCRPGRSLGLAGAHLVPADAAVVLLHRRRGVARDGPNHEVVDTRRAPEIPKGPPHEPRREGFLNLGRSSDLPDRPVQARRRSVPPESNGNKSSDSSIGPAGTVSTWCCRISISSVGRGPRRRRPVLVRSSLRLWSPSGVREARLRSRECREWDPSF
jgi:hypothetical protein